MRLSGTLAACLGLALASTSAVAEIGSAQGTIQHVYTYGDGRILVSGFNFSGASCTNNGGFVVYGSHPHFARLLSVVLSAKATGTTLAVTAKTDNCWYPEITADSTTYIVAFP